MGQIKKDYTCSLLLTNDLIGGKWKLRILWHILHGDNRFSLLQRGIPDITHKMLITQLKELEQSKILVRTDYQETPPRVEYEVAKDYQTIVPIIDALCDFTKEYAANQGIHLADDTIDQQ